MLKWVRRRGCVQYDFPGIVVTDNNVVTKFSGDYYRFYSYITIQLFANDHQRMAKTNLFVVRTGAVG